MDFLSGLIIGAALGYFILPWAIGWWQTSRKGGPV